MTATDPTLAHSPEGWARVVALETGLHSGDFPAAWAVQMEVEIAAAVRTYGAFVAALGPFSGLSAPLVPGGAAEMRPKGDQSHCRPAPGGRR
jgi:hypothetical protein